MKKEMIRKELKKQLFGQQRIRKSVDIENVLIDQQQTQTLQSFQDCYTLMNKIGEGAHSVVYSCNRIAQLQNPRPQQIYAVKCFRTDDPEIVNTIIQTFNLQRQLSDIPQVCRAYDLFIDQKKNRHYQVIQYCDMPNLQQVFHKLTLVQKRETIRQLSQTILQVHQKGICHRDLKPENILIQIEPEINIKLIDFGVCKRFQYRNSFREMWTATGTILYQAPEVFLGGGYDEKIDIWSIGVILYQLLCFELPFYADTVSDTIELITSQEYPFQNNQAFINLPQIERDLIKRLLRINPHQRLNAQEILTHPWFINIITTEIYDDSKVKQDQLNLGERTYSLTNQINIQLTEQQVQNLIDSFEWGQRIHYQN